MSEWTNKAVLPFADRFGRLIGQVLIASERKQNTIQLLDSEESREFGEEPIQLIEGFVYEYYIEEPAVGSQLQESQAVIPSSVSDESRRWGRLEPGTNTGILPLVLLDSKGKSLAFSAVEVQSSKLNYRDDYRIMLDFIAGKCFDLLLSIKAPSQVRLAPEPGSDLPTLQQRFAFLKSLIGSKEFHYALQRILSMPYLRLEAEPMEIDIRRGSKPTSQVLRQIASGRLRIPLPDQHPLGNQLKAYGIRKPSLPSKIKYDKNRETIDTPENRFIKHALNTYRNFFLNIEKEARKAEGKSGDRLCKEVIQLRENLTAILSEDFFKGISEPTMLPLGSPVLQRKSGYREMFQTWLKFDLAARLVWSGGDDVYGAGKRDIAVLYEYWLFFQLIDLISRQFSLKPPIVEKLIKKTKEGFGLTLKSGKALLLRGIYDNGGRSLFIIFSYNKTFKFAQDRKYEGSWTRRMRPDYTLSLWPSEFSQTEAEEQELMVHLHFDAKYRVESIEDLFGKSKENLQADRAEQRKGNYKRADLLKMHAYRDAIKRSEGAYVLYPGTDKGELWQGFHEILPGLGAFAIRPGKEGKAEGLHHISKFLEGVVNHLCNRASRREQHSYHTYKVYEPRISVPVTSLIPEREMQTGIRQIPPSEHYVLVDTYEAEEKLEWILANGVYYFSVNNSTEATSLPPSIFQIRHLLLVHKKNYDKTLLRIKNSQIRILSGKDLMIYEIAARVDPNMILIVYDVEIDRGFDKASWNIEKLKSVSNLPAPFSLDMLLT